MKKMLLKNRNLFSGATSCKHCPRTSITSRLALKTTGHSSPLFFSETCRDFHKLQGFGGHETMQMYGNVQGNIEYR